MGARRRTRVQTIAVGVPILPGKTPAWEAFMTELRGPRFAEFQSWLGQLGVRQRIYLQRLPGLDMTISTFEGPDLGASFVAFTGRRDPLTQWLMERLREIHGFDLDHPPPFTVAEPIFDSGG
jgi:hypothetical protein